MVETKLDPKEERQYKQLRRLGQKLHVPIPEHFITLEVFDKSGKLIQRHHQRSHSWVRNAYNCIFSNLAGKDGSDAAPFQGGRLNWKAIDAGVIAAAKPIFTTDATADDASTRGYRASVGNDDSGIVVGSGVNAEDFEDFVLQTLIVDGAAAGQLNYVEGEAHSITYAALTLKNTIVRYFNNNSGGDVNINEVGLVFGQMSKGVDHCLMSRDHLASTVTVPDTGQLKVTFTIELTYPS